jgi:RNA polymerase sigma-32 factor
MAMPYLTAAQEKDAARRFAEHGDRAAHDLLVDSHLRQVVKSAMLLARHGFNAEDLIQEGSIGLMQAVKKFDVDKGFRLTTYASWWIKAFMNDYLLQNMSNIRIPNTAKNKKALQLLSRAKNRLETSNHAAVESIYKKIAVAADCDIETVRLLHMTSTGIKSFSDSITSDEHSGEFGDFIPDNAPLPEEIVADGDERFQRMNMLLRAVKTLTDREATIFKARRMADADDIRTLESLSEEMGVSRERIRQIEVKAFEKVQAFIHKEQLAKRGEELARIAKSTTNKPKMILAAVTEPKKIAAPMKTPGWNVVTRNGESKLVFCQ